MLLDWISLQDRLDSKPRELSPTCPCNCDNNAKGDVEVRGDKPGFRYLETSDLTLWAKKKKGGKKMPWKQRKCGNAGSGILLLLLFLPYLNSERTGSFLCYILTCWDFDFAASFVFYKAFTFLAQVIHTWQPEMWRSWQHHGNPVIISECSFTVSSSAGHLVWCWYC